MVLVLGHPDLKFSALDSVSDDRIHLVGVRYLGGTSGSGGTIIGEYQTSSNGNIVITGLDAGTYVCEEISSPHGYVMDTAPQTAYISGKEQAGGLVAELQSLCLVGLDLDRLGYVV